MATPHALGCNCFPTNGMYERFAWIASRFAQKFEPARADVIHRADDGDFAILRQAA